MDKITLTPRQEAWLVKHFPNTKNDEIMAKLGLSHSTLHRMARQLGLKKTRQFISKCQAATTAAAEEFAEMVTRYVEPHKGDPYCSRTEILNKKDELKRLLK